MSALEIADTVEAGELRHRLALGLALRDSLTGLAASGPLQVELESIGPYGLPLRFDPHGADRHALRYAGRVRKRIDKTVADALDTRWVVRVLAPARQHVPRRLRLALAFSGGEPALIPARLNIRTPWLWPGAAYVLPATATAIRGRVLRGAALAVATPVRWARVIATIPSTELVFAAATPVGFAHGDDRGEFVVALERRMVSGAALTSAVDVRLWACLPPPVPPPDPAKPPDPLHGLPFEEAGLDTINAALRGDTIPPGYSAPRDFGFVSVPLGETVSAPGTTLLFP